MELKSKLIRKRARELQLEWINSLMPEGETITKEKGGIIKPGIPVVLAKQEKASISILRKICEILKASPCS